MNKEAAQRTLHHLAKVYNVLEMWQGSQNLHATQKECRAHDKQMTAKGDIWDTEEIVKASWSLFSHYGVAASKLSEKYALPSALTGKDLPG